MIFNRLWELRRCGVDLNETVDWLVELLRRAVIVSGAECPFGCLCQAGEREIAQCGIIASLFSMLEMVRRPIDVAATGYN
jgi:hypothetical protein